MFGLSAWLFVILAISCLIAWLGLWLLRFADRIKINPTIPEGNDHELSLLNWLGRTWQRLKKGGLRFERTTTTAELKNNPEVDEATMLSDTPPGEDAPSEGQQEPAQLTNVQLSIDIPVGARVRLAIETLPALPGDPEISVELNQNSELPPVHVTLHSNQAALSQEVAEHPLSRSQQTESFRVYRMPAFFKKIPIETTLFGLSLIIYLVTRLVGLDKFPIYFFTDEAVHTLLAENLVQNNFRFNGVFLPTYFSLGASFGLNSISVYLQVIPYLLFGKSVFITRAVSVLVTLLGAAAVGLILRDFLKVRYWWVGVLLLSATPVWFFHSRTAFENLELAAFYAVFLYFYLCYRLRSPKWLFLAIIAGALVFYTHGLGQFLMAATAGLLLLIDLPYHWKYKKIGLLGLGLILLLALPYFRFARVNPTIFEEQMRMRGAYWLDETLSLVDKLLRFGAEYLRGINPLYWFIPNPANDLARHQMKGYGYILSLTFPFFLVGLWMTLKNFRSPAHRTVLVALFVSPLGSAMAQIAVLRVIWFVIPVTLLIALGLEIFLRWLETKRASRTALSVGVFVFLFVINIYILQDALRNGPTWYTDYGLYGLQYGASQLFGEAIPKILEQEPNRHLVITPTWANGTDNFVRFFLTPEQQQRVRLDSIKAYLFERLPVDGNLTLVLTEPEYQEALASPKFKNVNPTDILYYPDGSAGFYFVQLEYSDQADAIFAAEKLARSQPVEATIQIDGQPVKIRYSQIDMGQPEAIFDGDIYTLMRGLEANPFIIELEFPQPRSISQIGVDFANMDFTLTASLINDMSGENQIYVTTERGIPGNPHVELSTNRGPDQVTSLRLEILSLNGGAEPHIHIREIQLLP